MFGIEASQTWCAGDQEGASAGYAPEKPGGACPGAPHQDWARDQAEPPR